MSQVFLKTGQVVRIAGPPASPVALHRLRKAGVLQCRNPQAPGGRRGNAGDALWTVRDALKVAVWARARRSGIGGRTLLRMLQQLDERFGEGQGLEMLLSGDAVLIADSQGNHVRVLLRTSPEQIVDLMTNQIVLPLFELKSIHEKIVRLPPPENRAARIHRALARRGAASGSDGA